MAETRRPSKTVRLGDVVLVDGAVVIAGSSTTIFTEEPTLSQLATPPPESVTDMETTISFFGSSAGAPAATSGTTIAHGNHFIHHLPTMKRCLGGAVHLSRRRPLIPAAPQPLPAPSTYPADASSPGRDVGCAEGGQ